MQAWPLKWTIIQQNYVMRVTFCTVHIEHHQLMAICLQWRMSDCAFALLLPLWVGSESSRHVTPMRRQDCWTGNACMGLLQLLKRKWLTECNQCAVNHEISKAKWFHTESLRTPQEILLYWSHLSCAAECSAGSSFLYYPHWWFHNITGQQHVHCKLLLKLVETFSSAGRIM